MSPVDQGTWESLAVSLPVALANNVSNKTYLKGLTQTLSLISNGAMNREQAMKNTMYQRLTGHAAPHVGRSYGKGYSLSVLVEAVGRLEFGIKQIRP